MVIYCIFEEKVTFCKNKNSEEVWKGGMLTHTLRIINQVILSKLVKPVIENGAHIVRFRCWPVDLDTNFHMNNACYFRIAELARWRGMTQQDYIARAMKNGWMFLVAEQKIVYKRSIEPFQSFEVVTSVTGKDNKWMVYKQVFRQVRKECEMGKEPFIFAEVEMTAVAKEKSGKTVKLDVITAAQE